MFDQIESGSSTNEQVLLAEIARLNEIIQALMDRAENSADIQSGFDLFHTAITLGDQVRRRTDELEAAMRENEKITRALHESEKLLQLFVENAPAALAMFDRDMRYLAVSRRWMTDYDLGDQNIIGRCHYEIFQEPESWKLLHRRGMGGEVLRSDGDFFERLDGAAYWLQWEIWPWRKADGSVGGIVLVSENITERKRAETVLRDKELLLSESQRIGHIGSWHYEFSGKLTWSEETYRICGVSPNTIPPSVESLMALIHPDDRGAMQEWIVSCATEKKPDALEFRIITPDGKLRIIRGFGELQYDSKNNTPKNLIGIVQDITERKQLEEALKESELRYRTVADYTSDWEYWIKPDGTFHYISPSCFQISGYTPDEFQAVPQLLTNIVHPEDLHLYVDHRHKTNDQGISESLDFRIYTKVGEIRWISHVCRPIYDLAGKHIGQRASNRDITERKLMEEQVRQLAFYDVLTNLPNRRLLIERLNQAMLAGKRSNHFGALMFLDLDNFKSLNDTQGHGVGDLLLIEVANRISGCVRETDTIARLGGDEFVVMLTDLESENAEAIEQANIIAEKIRLSLAQPYFLAMKQEGKLECMVEHYCTSSIGVALFIGHEASMDDLFKRADLAMYQAKQDGRNLIRFYDNESKV